MCFFPYPVDGIPSPFAMTRAIFLSDNGGKKSTEFEENMVWDLGDPPIPPLSYLFNSSGAKLCAVLGGQG